MERHVVLVGCPVLAPILARAGWTVHELEYFWGSDGADPVWTVAVIDIAVGGDTGLQVAERLQRCRVTPLVLHSRAERDQVASRFAGVGRSSVGTSKFFRLLELCAEQTAILRGLGASGETDAIEATSLIISEHWVRPRATARRAVTVRERRFSDGDRMQ